jgi:predicted CoA-binding protein
MSKLRDTIAQAIRDADKSFFNEDYVKQADNVRGELRKAGYEIVPLKPPPGLVQ